MTVDNLLYLTGALFDMFGALLITLGFYNISDENIKRFADNKIGNIAEGRAENIIRQRYEGIFGGGFIVFGSLLMVLATIFTYDDTEPKIFNDFLNKKISGIEAYLPIILVFTLFSILYWYVIPRISQSKLEKIK